MSVGDEFQKLRQRYAGLSDAELLGLARGRDGLVPAGQQALDAEVAARKLTPDGEADGVEATSVELSDEEAAEEVDPNELRLTRFGVTAELETAMNALEAANVTFRVEKAVATNLAGRPMDAVDLYVAREQQGQAVAVLRKELGLFPLPEVDERAGADSDEEGEELFSVANFESKADAETARQALAAAGIHFRQERLPVEADPEEGTPASEVTLFEVRFEDMDRAVEVVGAAFPD